MSSIVLRRERARIPWFPGLEVFRDWVWSGVFPEKGRIDYIGGELEIDMSPEEANTHDAVKTALGRELARLVEDSDRGAVYVDAMRLVAPSAELSVEPDVLCILFDSLEAGRVQLVKRPGSDRCLEIEGAADLVVEVVSEPSAKKDLVRLRERDHRAGVREYWIADARCDPPLLAVLENAEKGFVEVVPDGDGWIASPVLGGAIRLVRLPPRLGVVRYRLEARLRPG